MFDVWYPEGEDQQRRIANGFKAVSAAKVGGCAGAIDGILIWIHKPNLKEATEAGIGEKFFRGRKGKVGLNIQAVSDSRGRILDVSICYGGSSSDLMAFKSRELYARCEKGLMKSGFVLFGDNTYINTSHMVTPYMNVSGNDAQKIKDFYNFYHSQVRIRVECAFGILVNRWGLFRMAMPKKLSIVKIVSLVNALICLHNFCIDETPITRNCDDDDFEQFEEDRAHMLDDPSGYVITVRDRNFAVRVPTTMLMESSGSYADILKWEKEKQNKNVRNDKTLPPKILHDYVVANRLKHPIMMLVNLN